MPPRPSHHIPAPTGDMLPHHVDMASAPQAGQLRHAAEIAGVLLLSAVGGAVEIGAAGVKRARGVLTGIIERPATTRDVTVESKERLSAGKQLLAAFGGEEWTK